MRSYNSWGVFWGDQIQSPKITSPCLPPPLPRPSNLTSDEHLGIYWGFWPHCPSSKCIASQSVSFTGTDMAGKTCNALIASFQKERFVEFLLFCNERRCLIHFWVFRASTLAPRLIYISRLLISHIKYIWNSAKFSERVCTVVKDIELLYQNKISKTSLQRALRQKKLHTVPLHQTRDI